MRDFERGIRNAAQRDDEFQIPHSKFLIREKPMLFRRRTTVIATVVWIAVALVGSRPLAAQGTRATLRGTVKTAAGAARPSVTVNVVNLDNQNERQAITETDGTWSIAGLLPDRYEVRVDE